MKKHFGYLPLVEIFQAGRPYIWKLLYATLATTGSYYILNLQPQPFSLKAAILSISPYIG